MASPIVRIVDDDGWRSLLTKHGDQLVFVAFISRRIHDQPDPAEAKFREIASDHPNVVFAEVFFNEAGNLTMKCGVKRFPTYHIYRRGRFLSSGWLEHNTAILYQFVRLQGRYAPAPREATEQHGDVDYGPDLLNPIYAARWVMLTGVLLAIASLMLLVIPDDVITIVNMIGKYFALEPVGGSYARLIGVLGLIMAAAYIYFGHLRNREFIRISSYLQVVITALSMGFSDGPSALLPWILLLIVMAFITWYLRRYRAPANEEECLRDCCTDAFHEIDCRAV